MSHRSAAEWSTILRANRTAFTRMAGDLSSRERDTDSSHQYSWARAFLAEQNVGLAIAKRRLPVLMDVCGKCKVRMIGPDETLDLRA